MVRPPTAVSCIITPQVDIDLAVMYRPGGSIPKDPVSVTRFLNRLLGLESRKQNMVFEVSG